MPALARLSLSLFIPATRGSCTGHPDGGDWVTVSAPGDYTSRAFRATATTAIRPILSAVEVQTTVDGPVVVTLGDSITDGFLSSVGCNRRWPDLLAERFACDPQLSNVAVVNAGISGNRLLASDPLPLFGESALTRLNRDVLGVSGLTHVVVMEGINDLCAEPMASADELIAGIRQIIARVRAQGVRVILATLLPFVGSVWASQDREHARQTVNKWIVGQAEADGVIDFDAAVRDVDQPGRFKSDLHAGDWMHPNDAGYRRMADAVNLALFHM